MSGLGGGVPPAHPSHPVLFRRTVQTEQDLEQGHAGPRGPRSVAFQRMFALIGVAVGFVLLVVPGVLMRRRYLAWRAGERPTPGIAGPLGALVLWLGMALAAASVTDLDILVWVIFPIVLLPSLLVASRG